MGNTGISVQSEKVYTSNEEPHTILNTIFIYILILSGLARLKLSEGYSTSKVDKSIGNAWLATP